MNVGLRIDVDTLRGTREGVPALCRLLARHDIRATFFFSVGPDNMGRHLRRLVRPAFLWKMLRTRATRLYGWEIFKCGVFGEGPLIGAACGDIIRAAAEAGHEAGLHAWDHHRWQTSLDQMQTADIADELKRGMAELTRILGRAPICSAAPAWKCDARVLIEKARLPFAYHSDCRGERPFRPVVSGRELKQPQVPTTLPTYDEAVGRDGVTPATYNDFMLAQLRPDRFGVLTIHAEVEGIACLGLFERFVARAHAQGVAFVPLGRMLPEHALIGRGALGRGSVPGREGWLACQAGG